MEHAVLSIFLKKQSTTSLKIDANVNEEKVMTDDIVFEADDVAANYQTNISGWVSRNGFFYGNNEQSARRDGATHVLCSECRQACAKGRAV